ncbi:hypothetical protein [Bradyrhizobium sp. 18]|uniref:hypothetical protein n=1 Tax=Bradyrhizobium sp. 18 TaxID=2782657 RepID=UPI001FF73486|nr:hypothetical protein [Bradyrhizobium sp. 18]MCK1504300.1 hypothetical protein [Bradyrhizobium sp. 18]
MSIVIQKTRQLRMQRSEIRFVRRWAVLNFDSSALQPDLLLLSDRRQDANLSISDLEDGFIGIAVVVSDVNAMQAYRNLPFRR